MNKIHTHYDNLKVTRNASPQIIRAAYKVLVQQYHPDKNNGDSDASRIMAIINNSFEVLSDPTRRKAHDDWILEQETTSQQHFHRESQQNTQQPTPPHKTTLENAILQIKAWGKKVVHWMIAFISWSVAVGIVLAILIPTLNKNGFFDFLAKNEDTAANYDTAPTVAEEAKAAADAAAAAALAASTTSDNTESYTAEQLDPAPAEAPVPAEPLPYTGFSDNTYIEQIAPLRIKVAYGDNYWVKLEDAYSGETIAHYFIRSGDTLDTKVPLGTYIIKYAYGQNWYGKTYLFGTNTGYAQAESQLSFHYTGDGYSGHSIELIKQVNGNLSTSNISPEQF